MATLSTLAWDAQAQEPSTEGSTQPESSLGQDARTDTSSALLSPGEELALPQLPFLDLGRPNNTQAFAPRHDHGVFDTTLPGYFRIPTTKVFLKLGIGATTAFIVSSKLLGTPTWFTTSAIPVRGQPFFHSPGAQSTATANPSDVSLEMRGKTELGPMRLLFNTSFAQGKPAFGFHPNYAYAQLGSVLAGFTDSTFADVDAYPNTLDFEGPNALVFSKHAVARYSHSLSHDKQRRMSLHVALEQPGSNVPTSAGEPRDMLPDGVVAWRSEGGWGHLQLAGLVRAVGIQSRDSKDSKTVLGIGGNLTGAYHFSHKHTLLAGISGGQGLGAYLNDTGGAQYDAALNTAGALKAIPLLGAYAGFTYAWTHTLSSTATYGWLKLWDRDFEASLDAKSFRRSQYASLNLVARPMKGVLVGVEGLWGYNRAIDSQSGQAVRGQLTLQYRY
ncbi:DcaP family trimeric outer membrane transporter [Myxococcus sp. QH3KD-4-1]|nr:DcaP family trimeric outer membrane transporter [Myxococcus qinghaiensis]